MDSLLLSKHVCSQNSTILNQIQIQRATFAALRKFSVMFRSEINLKDLIGRIHFGQTHELIRKTYRYLRGFSSFFVCSTKNEEKTSPEIQSI